MIVLMVKFLICRTLYAIMCENGEETISPLLWFFFILVVQKGDNSGLILILCETSASLPLDSGTHGRIAQKQGARQISLSMLLCHLPPCKPPE